MFASNVYLVSSQLYATVETFHPHEDMSVFAHVHKAIGFLLLD